MSWWQNDWSGKMTWLQNVWVSKCLDLYKVAQCLGGKMPGWQNVSVAKCLVVKMSGCQKVGCPNFPLSISHALKCRRIPAINLKLQKVSICCSLNGSIKGFRFSASFMKLVLENARLCLYLVLTPLLMGEVVM